jgi:hypothetical protein
MKLWLAAAACATATLCAQTDVRITGRITAAGGPLRGEVIAVAGGGAVRISRAATDADGRFSISAAAGQVHLTAKADGYVSEERQVVVGVGGQNAAALHFVLAPAGSILGRVYDETGAGVAGARVWVSYRGEARRWRLAEEAGGEEADNFGYFTIPVVAQGKPFVLHAEREGWLMSSSGTLVVRAQEMNGVVLLLGRRGTIVRGRVFNDAGRPVAGAEVRLRCQPAKGEFTEEQRASIAFARSTNRTARSGADGTFVFTGVPAGQVVVTAGAGARRVASEVTTIAGRDTDLTLTVR